MAVIGQTPYSSEEETTEGVFSDIDGHWAEAEIEEMTAAGYLNGYGDGSFRPDNSVSRAEFVKIMVEMFGEQTAYTGYFTDVAASAWYAGYIGGALDKGWITGVSGSLFLPEDQISREDAVTVIYRMLLSEYAFGGSSGDPSVFADFDEVSTYAREAVLTLAENGILLGSDGRFFPQNAITRAEAAVVCLRVLEQVK